MKPLPIIGLFALILITIAPAAAIVTNNTANQAYYDNGVTLISGSYLHDSNYIPKEYVILMIMIGLIFWALSVSTPVCQDLFALMSPCFFGAAAWYSGYMAKDQMTVVTSADGTIYPVYTQIITPEPALQILCLIATVFTVLSAIYIIFLQNPPNPLKDREDTSQL